MVANASRKVLDSFVNARMDSLEIVVKLQVSLKFDIIPDDNGSLFIS